MVKDESFKSTDVPATPNRQKQINPIIPVVQKCTDNKTIVNGKTHRLPTTKEYLLQMYPKAKEFCRVSHTIIS